MGDLITQNPVLAFLALVAAVVAGTWKIFHELYVKPRDFRIDTLKEEVGKLIAEIDVRKSHTAMPVSEPQTAATAPIVLAAMPSLGPIVRVGPAQGNSANAAEARSPATSLAECYERWNDSSLTQLQKQRFEKEWTGKEVRWRVTVNAVSDASHGRIYLHVRDGEADRFGAPRAQAVFPERDEQTLLALKPGDAVIVTGTIREFFLGPVLESTAILKA